MMQLTRMMQFSRTTSLLTVTILAGCSWLPAGDFSEPVKNNLHSVTLNSFKDIQCQQWQDAGKNKIIVEINSVKQKLKLSTGISPFLAYALPENALTENGIYDVKLNSAVLHGDSRKKAEIFYPNIALLNKQGDVIRTLDNEQVKYQAPGFLTPEGHVMQFSVDNRGRDVVSCMVIYTTDEARKGVTPLLNEAKAFARVRGVVPPPVPDIIARHGDDGKLMIKINKREHLSHRRGFDDSGWFFGYRCKSTCEACTGYLQSVHARLLLCWC